MFQRTEPFPVGDLEGLSLSDALIVVEDISDIGADILKPFFIIGCIITALSLVGTLFAERWLRHEGRLTRDHRLRQKILAILAIIGSFVGGAGLILLSGFDTKRYTSLHRVFLGIFMLGVALSAIFTVAEVCPCIASRVHPQLMHILLESVPRSTSPSPVSTRTSLLSVGVPC